MVGKGETGERTAFRRGMRDGLPFLLVVLPFGAVSVSSGPRPA